MTSPSKSSEGADRAPIIISEHVLKRDVQRRLLITLVASLIAGMGAALWSMYRWYFAFGRFGPAVVWRWSAPAIAILLGALILAGYAGLFLISNRRRRILTTREGLWLVNGADQQGVLWSDVLSIQGAAASYIWSKSDKDHQLRIKLTTADGKTIKIPSFLTDLNDLNQTVKEHIYPLAMDRYRERMKSGQQLDFGPLQLTRTGVVYHRQTNAWQSFRDVKLENGRLEIVFDQSEKHKRISIPARRIPNIDLCVQLLKNIEF